jgi:hypothetical protein
MSVASAFAPEPGAPQNRETKTDAVRLLRRAPSERELAELEGPAARVGELAQAIADRIRGRPLASLGVAVGVGFLVGGALSFRAGRIVLAAAARRVAREVLKQVL